MPKIDGMLQRVFAPRRPEPVHPTAETPTVASEPAVKSDELSLSKTLPKSAENLTAEEKVLIAKGLLPETYGELKAIMEENGVEAAKKAYRKGKEGPFDTVYGDPTHMLWLAKNLAKSPEWSKLAKDLQPGDIVFESFNSLDNPIAQLTDGPFVHARLCVSVNPPEFIEAVGITGMDGDPTNNMVRRSPMPYGDSMSIRLMRPTDGMSEPQKSRAIARAITFAEEQLGKPYDYSFTNLNQGKGLTDAFYCSELTYLAYASAEGANLNMPVDKSAERDQMIVAINDIVEALKPKNKPELLDDAIRLFNRNPKPTGSEVVEFLVDHVMVECEATENITKTPEDRAKLKDTIQTVMEGKAFPKMQQSLEDYNTAKAEGAYDMWLVGWAQEQKDRFDIGAALVQDLGALVTTSGVDVSETLNTALQVANALLPHSEVLASFLYGPKDGRTQAVGQVLDTLEWLKQNVPELPFVGNFGLSNLPERAKPSLKTDFVSPSDLAWADLYTRDYNVKPGFPIDRDGFAKYAAEKAAK